MSDDKDEKINDTENESEDTDLEVGSEEPDFAPTTAAPAVEEDDDLEADPHSAFDTPAESEDPHGMDIYGDGGVPGEEDDEEDDEDGYDGDSSSY